MLAWAIGPGGSTRYRPRGCANEGARNRHLTGRRTLSAYQASTTRPGRSILALPRLSQVDSPLTYRPELDGLRGIAVLLVIGGHLLVPGMGGGAHVGVTIFFVLSGYLITSVLREKHDLAAFYVRRARRLLPALLVWVLALTLAGVITARDALPPLLYVANWAAVGGGLSTPLAHTWSLATEEQFYLLWPLVLIAMRRPVGLLVFVILAGGFYALRCRTMRSGLSRAASMALHGAASSDLASFHTFLAS